MDEAVGQEGFFPIEFKQDERCLNREGSAIESPAH
jgi:hypothetical protein